jgi:predicted metal-dependent hydrolase
MPQRRVNIPEIGEVVLAKRRGARNLRLSITAKGEVRVSMPSWSPYAAGVSFARSRANWINKHLQDYSPINLRDGMLIGKAHRLHFVSVKGQVIKTKVAASMIEIRCGLPFDDPQVQAKAATAAERALKAEAEHLLPQRLRALAHQHGYSYKDVRIRKLISRWGSCSNDKTISLSYYLMQLPWPLIDYVLVHELIHTRHLNHGPDFWAAFEAAIPGAKNRRKQLRSHKPRLEPH